MHWLIGVVVVAVLFALGKGAGGAIAAAEPTEFYRGLAIYVAKDGAAWRWTVKNRDTPLATGLSVLDNEALVRARMWIDDLWPTEGEQVDEVDAPESHPAAAPAAGEPTDLTPGSWYVLDRPSTQGYAIIVQSSARGFLEPQPWFVKHSVLGLLERKVEHFRWTLTDPADRVLSRGWAETPRDARDEGVAALAAHILRTKGIDLLDEAA